MLYKYVVQCYDKHIKSMTRYTGCASTMKIEYRLYIFIQSDIRQRKKGYKR